MKLRRIPTRARRTWSTRICLKGYDVTQTFQTSNMWLNCTCLCNSRIPDSTSHLRSFLKESWSYISHTTLYKGTIPCSLQGNVKFGGRLQYLNLLTNIMEKYSYLAESFYENDRLLGQEMYNILQNLKVQCTFRKIPPLDPVESQLNSLHILLPYLF